VIEKKNTVNIEQDYVKKTHREKKGKKIVVKKRGPAQHETPKKV